jgi:hypothetical protein
MPAQFVQPSKPTWRNVLPAAAPGCSQGTPYSFWAKEGDPTKLAVILAGGGACWTGENCALHGRPFYRPFAGLEQDPSNLGGVFDIDNPENPLADYTIVYLPTANGDVFLGDSVTTYDVPAMGGQPEGKMISCTRATIMRRLPWIGCSRLTRSQNRRRDGMERRGNRIAPLHAYRRSTLSDDPRSPISPMAGAPIAWAKNLRRSSNPGGQRTF